MFGSSTQRPPIGQHLVSTYSGEVIRLAEDASAWEKIYEFETGRFFHHMLTIGKSSFALVGGSHMRYGSYFEVEIFDVVDSNQGVSQLLKQPSTIGCWSYR